MGAFTEEDISKHNLRNHVRWEIIFAMHTCPFLHLREVKWIAGMRAMSYRDICAAGVETAVISHHLRWSEQRHLEL